MATDKLQESLPQKLWRYGFVIVSRLGDRVGSDTLTYNWGVTHSFHNGALRLAPRLVPCILAQFPDVRRLADVGCGTGVYAKAFMDKGLEVVACEYGARGRRWAQQQGVRCLPFDVSKDTSGLEGRPFDLAMNLEVAEHVPAGLADAYVEYLANTAPLLVFSAAHPGQDGIGHINCQPKSYWLEKFGRHGIAKDDRSTDELLERFRSAGVARYLQQNAMVLRRAG